MHDDGANILLSHRVWPVEKASASVLQSALVSIIKSDVTYEFKPCFSNTTKYWRSVYSSMALTLAVLARGSLLTDFLHERCDCFYLGINWLPISLAYWRFFYAYTTCYKPIILCVRRLHHLSSRRGDYCGWSCVLLIPQLLHLLINAYAVYTDSVDLFHY